MLTLTAFIAIVSGTLIAEDATAIGVGLAVRDGTLPFTPSLLACVAGIFMGDVGLWAIGRFAGRRVMASRRFSRYTPASLASLGDWVDRHPAIAILGSRFTPGARLPLYVAAGVWGRRPWRFVVWMALAVAIWTPLLVFGAASAGRAVTTLAGSAFGESWLARAATLAALVVLLQSAAALTTREGRSRASVRWARLRRWEFWPSWVLYAPIAVWIVWLAVRHRGLTVFTAANPGVEHSGIVGESKQAILSKLPAPWVLPWVAIEPGPLSQRLSRLREGVASLGGRYPFVLKPDVGERGNGVRWLRNEDEAAVCVAEAPHRLILQAAHDGPFEAGVFYVRWPGASTGRIFSLTDKRFPWIVGDGHSSLEMLVCAHPRYRLQADVFLKRHASERTRILAAGERVRLAQAGNHCQGTEFRDGRALLTPALEARVDAIARQFDGFYFGRFDVRYRDRDAFMAGREFSIVELNGVTSEATHIYDPAGSLRNAWRTLAAQWSLAFAIGAANVARGCQPTPVTQLARILWTSLRDRPQGLPAD